MPQHFQRSRIKQLIGMPPCYDKGIQIFTIAYYKPPIQG